MVNAKKDSHLTVRISPEELETIKEYAKSNGLQFSDFVLGSIRSAMTVQEGIDNISLHRRIKELENVVARLTTNAA